MSSLDTSIDTPLTMTHKMTWDIVPYADVRKALVAMDMTAPGPDVGDREEQASRERLGRLKGLVPQIVYLANISANVLSRSMLEEHENMLTSEKDLITDMITKTAIGSSLAVVANMLDLELLTRP